MPAKLQALSELGIQPIIVSESIETSLYLVHFDQLQRSSEGQSPALRLCQRHKSQSCRSSRSLSDTTTGCALLRLLCRLVEQ